jgi:carbamate kinase
MAKIILIALGGNAIKQSNEKGSSEEQFKNCWKTTKHISEIIKNLDQEDRLIITHGNGPQVGNLMVQQKLAQDIVPAHPMDVVGAMTQGQIGYMLQQTFIIKQVKPNGERCWRRTVPSPDPIANLEAEVIKKLVKAGVVVIASGGGGIPVLEDEKGNYQGIEAVIDKDLAGERLAEIVGADIFLILTDVGEAKINYGKANEKGLSKITFEEAKQYFDEGHFLAGSMGPKVKACLRFLENGGKKAIITSLDKALEALKEQSGTIIEK